MVNKFSMSEIILASRSKKLKLFLMADLILLAFVIPGYFYIDSQISNPAEFQITDLILDSNWVTVGESVQISVNVTNIGDEPGNHTVTVTIDDAAKASKTVQLSGKESIRVNLEATGLVEGNHTVNVSDLYTSLKVTSETPTRPAKMEITNLGISRIQAGIGEAIIISATATNTGDVSGNFEIEVYINNIKRATRNIYLNSGQSTTEEFEVVEQVLGTFVVEIDNQTKTFEIISDVEPPKPAEFQVTGLTVNPGSVLAGEIVDISVTLTNVGEESGSYSVNLTINDNLIETTDITLSGGGTKVVEFEVNETNSGSYNVQIAGLSNSFTVETLSPASPNIELKAMAVSPYEVWGEETVTIKAKATNLINEPGTLHIRLLIDGIAEATKTYSLDAGATDIPIEFSVKTETGPTDGKIKGFKVQLVNLGIKNNTLNGYFQIAPDGFHSLSINRSGGGSTPMVFTFDGETYESPYFELLPVGEYSLSTDKTVQLRTGVVEFSHWNDGVTSESRTFILDRQISMLANYIVISGYASCPSLYFWNGINYTYVTEVSNGGWLGYMDYMTEDGNIVFSGGNPWDHVKLDQTQIQPKNDGEYEYYESVLFQQWDEIFYIDTAYLVAVDHPNNTQVYSTMINYVNKGFYGTIYTTKEESWLTPISAINEKGDNVISQIAKLDGNFTPASNGVTSSSWDNITLNRLTLDLGDLSGAPEIKLIINGMVDWGPPEPYYEWIDKFTAASAEGLVPNGTKITPPSYMEVLNSQGNWIQVPPNRQIPIPGDYIPRTFAVDLNGLFPIDGNEYKIRLTNFWNVTFDYIGIDITPQENITINEIFPEATLEPLDFATTNTNASGNFTKYGDVSELLLEADDKFVIGIQGDKVSLKFPTTELKPLEEGMQRSFFVFVASWFKDEYGNWGYGFEFTVDPLPFQDMSGFPYPSTESYPSTEEYLNYLKEWNTRIINVP
jgi:hypothetical protein